MGVTHARSVGFLKGVPERLDSKGWDVHIVTGHGPQTDVYKGTPITVHHIAMERQPALAADLNALRSWRRLLGRLRPDVVLIGTPKASFLGILSAWLTRVPIRVYHVRGLPLESARNMRRFVLMAAEKLTCAISTETLAVSKSLGKLMVNLKLVAEGKVRVIGSGSSNGVDVNRFTPGVSPSGLREELELHDNVPVIGFVGRITPDKGSRELRIASEILEEHGIEHQLLIVGSEENERQVKYLSNMRSRYKPVFTGHVKDTAPYYKLMDILCLPTYREGFPNVVLEAGASGVPVVTTNATGAVDSVVEGKTGKIVPVGSGRETANALTELLSNDDLRRRLGENAREYVSTHFERSELQSEFIYYIQDLLDLHNSGR